MIIPEFYNKSQPQNLLLIQNTKFRSLAMTNIVELAEQIVKTNNQGAYAQIQTMICDPQTIGIVLNQIGQSEMLHFAFTQILTKSIMNGQFCPINETKSDDNMHQTDSDKSKYYAFIIPKVYESIQGNEFPGKSYILKSAINLIAICLKDLCDNNRNLKLFNQIICQTLYPSFVINQTFISSLQQQVQYLKPSMAVINYLNTYQGSFICYRHSTTILIQLLDYMMMVSTYKTYYEYRRNIYTFRNTYLPIILNIATEYYMILFAEWRNNPSHQILQQLLNLSITFIEKVITYPFSLTLHEFQSEDEAKDTAMGTTGQIYFPAVFRNVLCDNNFVNSLLQYYMILVKEVSQFQKIKQLLYSLIRILARFVGASQYTFNSQKERYQFRYNCVEIVLSILFSYRFHDFYYIDMICEIICKVINTYTNKDYEQKQKQKIYQGILLFCDNIIDCCPIKIRDGKKNPFNRSFQILGLLITENKDEENYLNVIKQKSQRILEKALSKITNNSITTQILKDFGFNLKQQIQCFQQLYEHLQIVFAVNLERNLMYFDNADLNGLNQCSLTFWLHLCATILPKPNANLQQTRIILKYFYIAKQNQSVAALHYISTLVSNILQQMDNGKPTTLIWNNIESQTNIVFQQFIMFMITLCKKQFQKENFQLVDYALQAFKRIYTKLKKNNSEKFETFYGEVKVLISNLNDTVFENPKYFKKRVDLFNVISTIWINGDNYSYIYDIYDLISLNLKKNPTNLNFLKYMYDIRGALEPIDTFQNFKIFCQLALVDLRSIFPALLGPSQINYCFSDPDFLKAFCKMVLQFMSDTCRRLTYQAQTDLTLQLHDLFKPYIQQAINYDYPKTLIKVLIKFIALNPIQQILPLPVGIKQKQSNDLPLLIREYFQNIHRVPLSQLELLYPFIEDRVQFLVDWWEQIVRRNLYPKISLVQVVNSRIATTNRQKDCLAKLIYYVGTYDSSYWNVSQYPNERSFVKWFVQNYKDFKDN